MSTRPSPALVAAATAAAGFVAALLLYALWPEPAAKAVAWEDVTAQAGPLFLRGETRRVFRTQEDVTRYFRGVRAPQVDFPHRQLLLVSPGPRSASGYEVGVVRVQESGGDIRVVVRERVPAATARVEPRVTFPVRLLTLPAGRDVYVEWAGR